MSPAHVLEPTYDAIRRRLVAGAWQPGFRLEAARLAGLLGVSITPVRDSLNRLTGERLVDAWPSEGFRVPRLEGRELRELIGWHHELVRLARKAGSQPRISVIQRGNDGIAERTSLLFAALARDASEIEARWALGNAAARLAPYRKHEATILSGVDEELNGIEAAVLNGNDEALGAVIEEYHHRRQIVSDELVRAARDN
jgi:DNA-binding GntR family transcriptional regulator